MQYVMLDRDGVINEDSDAYIKTPAEWQPIPGSLDAIALLHRNDYRVVVITNQSGIARGLYNLDQLDRIHAKMRRVVEEAGGKIESIYFCPHGPNAHCDCRKPKPGLLKTFARDKLVSLDNMPCIGDSLRDIEAALAVGARPILVTTGKGKKTLMNNPPPTVPVFENLYEAAHFIVSGK